MKTITAVPESISRETYLNLLALSGFDINAIRQLEFRPDGIYAEVFEDNAEGNHMADPTSGEVILNRVYIPVVD